jgi:hypothetical protein
MADRGQWRRHVSDVMESFVDGFANAGFQRQRFLPEYGGRSDPGSLADAAGRASASNTGRGKRKIVLLSFLGVGTPAAERPYRAIVNCGRRSRPGWSPAMTIARSCPVEASAKSIAAAHQRRGR